MRSNPVALIGLALLLLGGAAAALYWAFAAPADSAPPIQTAELNDPAPQEPQRPAPRPDVQPERQPGNSAQPAGTDAGSAENHETPVIRPVESGATAEAIRQRSRMEFDGNRSEDREFSATISGRVSDSTGRGIEGATVKADGMPGARRALGRAGQPRFTASTKTNAAGEYELELKASLPPGVETLSAQVTAGAPGNIPGEPLALDSLQKGEHRRGADLAMKTAAIVRGKVFDNAGTPLEGITIVATRRSEERTPIARRGVRDDRGAARTDENGEWKMDALTPGEWTFSARGPEHEQPVEQRFTLALAEGVESVAQDIIMLRATTIRARLLTSEGKAIGGPGVRVTAVLKLSTGQVATATGTVDAEGNAVFARVAPTAVEMTVRVNGYEIGSATPVSPLPNAEYDAGTIYLTPASGD